MKIKIAHFQNNSKRGRELSGLITQVFNNIEINGVKTEVRIVENGNQFDFLQACLGDDVVIFDGSIEDVQGSNYEAATAQVTCMDHVLVVGRTKLPLNFFGLRKGGHPELIKSSTTEVDKDFENDRIIIWIRENLNDLAKDLPRSEEERVFVPSFSEISQYSDRLDGVSRKIMERSLNKYKKRDNIFISYLSKYSSYQKGGKSFYGKNVEDVIEFIKREKNINMGNICYFPPGSISGELMIEQRRWQIISIIDRYIRLCKEFWIFETPDYYDSWWTQAELASLAYIKCHAPEDCPEIYICTVSNEKSISYRKAESNFIFELSERHKSEMARFFSNSDPATVGYESIENMRNLKKLPRLFQRIYFKKLKKLASSGAMGGTLLNDALEDLDFDTFLQSVNSHVYTTEFWNDYLITCPYCFEKNSKRNKYDFEKFLYSENQGINRLDESQFRKVLSTKEWRCAKCDKAFKLIEEKNRHFIWWPVRMGKATGPDGNYIESRKLYSITESN